MKIEDIRVYETQAGLVDGKPVLYAGELRKLVQALNEDKIPDRAVVNVDPVSTTRGVVFNVTVVHVGGR